MQNGAPEKDGIVAVVNPVADERGFAGWADPIHHTVVKTLREGLQQRAGSHRTRALRTKERTEAVLEDQSVQSAIKMLAECLANKTGTAYRLVRLLDDDAVLEEIEDRFSNLAHAVLTLRDLIAEANRRNLPWTLTDDE